MRKVHNNFFISYILSDQVWWCNIKRFLSYSKNYTCKFMQANSWHKLFHFHLSFWIWKVWKGRGKITKAWISRERKELFRWNKSIFHNFWRAIIWWKNKNLINNSGPKLSLTDKCLREQINFLHAWNRQMWHLYTKKTKKITDPKAFY